MNNNSNKFNICNIAIYSMVVILLASCSTTTAPRHLMVPKELPYTISNQEAEKLGNISPSASSAYFKTRDISTYSNFFEERLPPIQDFTNDIYSSKKLEPLSTKKVKSKVAILLPLTGEFSNVGQNMLNAAEMAIFDVSSDNDNIALAPYDTKGSEQGAILAIEKALAENAAIILGPVFRHTTRAIIPIARKENVNVISFSNDISLHNRGIYLLGFLPSEQINRVVEYATKQGIVNFSSLIPDNLYGKTVEKSFRNSLLKENIIPKDIGWYKRVDKNLTWTIKRIAEGNQSLLQSTEEALLIPEGGSVLSSITNRLSRKSIRDKKFRILGSGNWESSEIENEKRLIGSWFAASPPAKRKLFENNFLKTFDYKPVRIASLAYDAIALASLIADKNFKKESITDRRGFVGINGLFRFTKNGVTERNLSIIEITEYGFSIIDPAPEYF